MKRKNASWYNVGFLCLILSSSLMFSSNLESREPKIDSPIPHTTWKLSDTEYHWHNEQYNIALDDAYEAFSLAKRSVASLPKKKDRKKIEKLFQTVVFKAISLKYCIAKMQHLISSLESSDVDVYTEYGVIRGYLIEAKYNFEITLYHLRILKKDGRGPVRTWR